MSRNENVLSHVIMIPARRASARMPAKLLRADTGLPLILHTCQSAAEVSGKELVHVCVDDDELFDIVTSAGYHCHRTGSQHQSGTDRIAEVAAHLDVEMVVNFQGDEPELPSETVGAVLTALAARPEADIATAVVRGDAATQENPAAVKAIVGANGLALYFTRAPVVYERARTQVSQTCWRHVGIYAYRKESLLRFAKLPPSPLEQSECLEQLRALENGMSIVCAEVVASAAGIDTEADYLAFCRRMAQGCAQ